MIIGSATIDNVEFTGRAGVCYLLCLMGNAAVINFTDDPQYPNIMGTEIKSEEQKNEIREVIQGLRRLFKSDITTLNHANRQTKIFVPTRFDEDGFDGEEFHGIEFKINYIATNPPYITIDAGDKIVFENPAL